MKGKCRLCGAPLLFARTPKGALMPIELTRRPDGDLTANVAAYRTGSGGAFARVLKDGERPDATEWRTVAHAVVCPNAVQNREARKGAIKNVIPFPIARVRRQRRADR